MVHIDDNAGTLMGVLSDRLLQDFPRADWRHAFLDKAPLDVQFTREVATFLCTDAPEAEWEHTGGTVAAGGLPGYPQHKGGWTTLSYGDPRVALEVALHLQRTSTLRVRCAIVTSRCTMATYERNGETFRISLGCEHAVLQSHVSRAPPGTIHLCAETYLRLEGAIHSEAPTGLLATELEDDVVTSAALTLPPTRHAALSTFAGLGLT